MEAACGYINSSSGTRIYIVRGLPPFKLQFSSRKHAYLLRNKSLSCYAEASMRNDEGNPDGISIRRRPTTGPPLHYVGPFEFRLENEGNTPRNILEEIVWNKDREVTEIKIAQAYERGGAACISVLTDSKYFQGSFDDLEAIRDAGIKCPLLCKEFIIDAWQLYYARFHGADAVLLIAGILPDQDLRYMTKICKLLQMSALVEVVGESGLFMKNDIALVQKAGANAVLVGESIVKHDDPAASIAELFGKNIAIEPRTNAELSQTLGENV